MADNVTLDTMSGGDSVAADDIAGVKFQRIKLTLGSDGVNDNDVSSGNPMPVSLASVPSHAVTNAGTFAVQVDGSALTALQNIDTDVTTIIGHVDGLEGLLTTIDADTGNIATSVQLIDDTIFVAGTDTYTEATSKGQLMLAVRRDADTTLANTTNEFVPFQVDANGYLKVEIFDGGGSHTVDNNGTFAVQVDGNALTSLQLIDDVIFIDDTATHSTGSTKGVGIMAVAVPTDTSVSANDIGMVAMSTDRRQLSDVTLQIADADVSSTNAVPTKGVPSDIDVNGSNANHAQKYYTNAGAVTDGIIWSPAAGKRWHILSLYINVSAAATVTLEDDLGAGDSAVFKGEFAANSGIVLKYDKEHPFSSTEDAADLIITTSAGNVYVQAVGYEV